MRKVPGIDFVQEHDGRLARVAGHGLEVRDVTAIYKGVDENWDRLKGALQWFSDAQLKAALEYYRLYLDKIDEYIAAEEEIEEEARRNGYPMVIYGRDR